MAALVVVDVRITDPGKFEEYERLVPATLAPYGGRFLARGGRASRRSRATGARSASSCSSSPRSSARAWWASDGYRLPREMRMESAETRMIAVESV